jgi:Tfp pilus assembly pilus retraction ATPase PilT
MRNQYMAKVLFSNNLVTNEQVQEYWGKITRDKDIGQVLCEAGLLDKNMYEKVLAYVQSLEAKLSSESKPTPPSTAQSTPSAAPSEPQKVPPQVKPQKEIRPPTNSKKLDLPEEPSFKIEGNSLYGDASTTPIQVEVISGLESTSITNIQLKAEEDQIEIEGITALPDQFAIETGEGEIAVPDAIDPSMSLTQILSYARKFNSTDIYLYDNRPIVIRQSGSLHYACETVIESNQLIQWLAEASRGFVDGKEPAVGKNFSKTFALTGAGRARLSVTWVDVVPFLAIRIIPLESVAFDDLYLPAFCKDFLELESGLILIAGPSSSGRSTTMSTFAETIAKNNWVYIQTIEKPIERLLSNPNGIIAQKEVGLHTSSGLQGIRSAINDGADIILFDHLEKMDELGLLLQAANAGTLVFAVASGNNILALLTRFLDSVSDIQRPVLAQSLADQLKGVIVQHLVPVVDKQGEVLAVEAMKTSPSIANMIRKGELSQIPAALSAMKGSGQTLDDSLQKLVESGYIEGIEAWKRAFDTRRFASYRPSKKN